MMYIVIYFYQTGRASSTVPVVECLLRFEGLWVRVLLEGLHCVLEQDTILCLVLVKPKKTHPDMTEKLLTGT